MQSTPWRIVLDTASFISALRSSRVAAYQLLRLVIHQRLTIVMDLKLSLEYEDVAFRVEHLRASGLSSADIRNLLSDLRDSAEPVQVSRLLRPLSPDPNDDMILELAVSASVHAIVTPNVRHFAQAARTFDILVLTPGELLAKLKGKSDDL